MGLYQQIGKLQSDSLAGTSPIAIRTPELALYEARRTLPRDLMLGTDGMQGARLGVYLPKKKGESAVEYANRILASFLDPFFITAVNNMTGKVFSSPIKFADDVPAKIRGAEKSKEDKGTEGWAENIDLQGNNAHVFLRLVFQGLLVDGVGGILVETAKTVLAPDGSPAKISVKEAERQGVRPYWVHVPASAILEATQKTYESVPYLDVLRVSGVVDGRKQVRKLVAGDRTVPGSLASWELWEELLDKPGEYAKIDEGTASYRDIPFALCSFDQMSGGYACARPPLDHLAEQCLKQFRLSAGLDYWMDAALGPLLHRVVATAQEALDQAEMGPYNVLYTTNPSGRLEWIAPPTESFAAGKERLAEVEHRINELSLKPLTNASLDPTATEVRIVRAEAHSQLQAQALVFKDFVEQALMITAGMMNLGNGGSVLMTTDFGGVPEGQLETITMLRTGQNGRPDLSREGMFAILKTAGQVPDDFDVDADQERVGKELQEAGGGLGALGRDRSLARLVGEKVQGGMPIDQAVAEAEDELARGAPN